MIGSFGEMTVRLFPAGFLKAMRPFLAPAAGVALAAYLAFHGVHGSRGVLAWYGVSADVDRAALVLQDVETEQAWWEHRVAGLRGNERGLDLDLLDERVRAMLSMGHADDVIILFDGEKGN